MNCQGARQLLEFARPRGFDLDSDDRAALEAHLEHCPECDALLRGRREFDDKLGTAVRDVPAPKGLAERIKARLRQERDDYWRQWLGRVTRYTAAAAAVLLLGFFGFNFWREHRPRAPGDDAVKEVERFIFSPRDRDAVRSYLASRGEKGLLLPDFNYTFLRSVGVTELADKRVPCLLFVRPASAESAAATAEVYLLRSDRFNLSDLAEGEGSGDRYKVRVELPRKDCAYVIVYTGNLNDLRAPAAQAQ